MPERIKNSAAASGSAIFEFIQVAADGQEVKMDTLDAKTRIMNEIDSIDVQILGLQEKISELHCRKNQFKEAYSAIIGAEQQAERLLAGLLKAADIAEPRMMDEGDNIWEASAEEVEAEAGPGDDRLAPLPVMDHEAGVSMTQAETEEVLEEEFAAEPEPSEINGRRRMEREVPSFLRQYL